MAVQNCQRTGWDAQGYSDISSYVHGHLHIPEANIALYGLPQLCKPTGAIL